MCDKLTSRLHRKVISITGVFGTPDQYNVVTGVCIWSHDSNTFLFVMRKEDTPRTLRIDEWQVVYEWKELNPLRYLSHRGLRSRHLVH